MSSARPAPISTSSEHNDEVKVSKKPVPYKTFKASETKDFKPEQKGDFVHQMFVVSKPGKNSQWFAKTINPEKRWSASREVIAGEFFRLILPRQPKTRRWQPDVSSTRVLSKAVPGFVSGQPHGFDDAGTWISTHDHVVEKFEKNPHFQNDAAEILVVSLFLDEFDLRPENTGFDENNRFIRIDFDQCFAQFIHKYSNCSHGVTLNDLKRLRRFAADKTANNWLSDCFFQRANRKHPEFLQANHRTLLKLLFLPDVFLEAFVSCYVAPHEEAVITPTIAPYNLQNLFARDFLIKRRDLFKKVALEWPEFVTYLCSDQAKTDFLAFKQSLSQFRTMSKYVVWNEVKEADQLMTRDFERTVASIRAYQEIKKMHFDAAEKIFSDHPDLCTDIYFEKKPFIQEALRKKAPLSIIKKICVNEAVFKQKEAKDSLVALAAKHQHYDALNYFLESHAKQFTADALGWALIYLLIDREWRQAKTLLAAKPYVTPIVTRSDNSPIHLVLREQKMDPELVEATVKIYDRFNLLNKDKQDELTLAMAHPDKTLLLILLKHAAPHYSLNQVKQALRCFRQANQEEKQQDLIKHALHHIDVIARCQGQPSEKIKLNHLVIKSAIRRCHTADQVTTLMAQLEEQEQRTPFFKTHSHRFSLFSYAWREETVSNFWISIVKHAKERIMTITRDAKNPTFHLPTRQFLAMRTSKLQEIRASVPDKTVQYHKLTNTRGLKR